MGVFIHGEMWLNNILVQDQNGQNCWLTSSSAVHFKHFEDVLRFYNDELPALSRSSITRIFQNIRSFARKCRRNCLMVRIIIKIILLKLVSLVLCLLCSLFRMRRQFFKRKITLIQILTSWFATRQKDSRSRTSRASGTRTRLSICWNSSTITVFGTCVERPFNVRNYSEVYSS